MLIKVCGMREAENIRALCQIPIDYIGFIFFEKSPRFAEHKLTTGTAESVPASIKKTGVFVNARETYIKSIADKFNLNAIQLHGSEPADYCKSIATSTGLPIIKAFGVDEGFDFSALHEFDDACDFFLFDTKSPKHGGTGQKFNWQILENHTLSKPIFLSGGITSDDFESVLNISRSIPVHAIDINSKFETKPALKDIPLISRFVEQFKNT